VDHDERVRLARASKVLLLLVYPLEKFSLKAGAEMLDRFKGGRRMQAVKIFLFACHWILSFMIVLLFVTSNTLTQEKTFQES